MVDSGVLTGIIVLLPFCTNEETEAQSIKETCPRSNSLLVVEVES
jgi:hypothetical protein